MRSRIPSYKSTLLRNATPVVCNNGIDGSSVTFARSAEGVAQNTPGWSAGKPRSFGTFRMNLLRVAQKAAGFRMRHLLCCAALAGVPGSNAADAEPFRFAPPKGLPRNNRSALARAPGGQMQGAATQAMWCHRRGEATQQMPARRRAPRAAARKPAGVVARSLHTARYARHSRLASGPGGLQRSASLILSQALRDMPQRLEGPKHGSN